MDNDSIINELCDFAAWIRREQGVASQTVDISGASAAMQAGGMPRRGQDLPNATPDLRWPCGGWRGYPTPESE